MHRPTIDAYDAGAEHWLASRYRASGQPHDFAVDFRNAVGSGLVLDLGCGPFPAPRSARR